MNVHLERHWAQQDWAVWMYERTGGGQIAMLHLKDDGTFERRLRPANETFDEPSFRLPGDALEALVREAGNVLQSSDATVSHLADAVATRDRLLALVEAGWSTA